MAWEVTSKRKTCEGCPFYGAKVGTRGPLNSPFMIVGESPGKEELRDGIPFVGKSWQVLKHAIEKSGYPPLEVEPYVTNAFHCFPGTTEKNEETVNKAAACCHSKLVEEINAYPRKLLLVLGSPALRSVTNNYGLKITKERGKLITADLCPEIRGVEHALITIHPAFILRGGGNYRQFRGDVRYALQLFHTGEVKRNPVVDYLVLDSEPLLYKLLQTLERLTLTHTNTTGKELDVAADIETGSPPDDPFGPGGFDWFRDSILSIGLAYDPTKVYIIPEEYVDHAYTRRIFQISRIRWIWHHGKFDIKFLRAFEIPARVDEDTMLQSYTLDERSGAGRVHGLEVVSHDWLASPDWKGMLDKHVKKGQSYRAIPKDILYKYQAYDVSNTLRLKQVMQIDIDADPHNSRIYYDTFIPATEYLANVEDRGICVDFNKVKENELRLRKICQEVAEPIFEAALKFQKDEINSQGKKVPRYNEKLLNSPLQLAKLLFDDLKLPCTVRSTTDDILEKLPPVPVVIALRRYRKVFKQLSTYVLPLYRGVLSDGKMHTQFKLHVTATGRLASGDPMNMQNIPRDADIRGQFVPAPGHIYIEPDLNQAELRSLAAFSEDPELIRIYTDPTAEGIHDTVRQEMYGDPKNWNEETLHKFMEKFHVYAPESAQVLKGILDEQKMKAKNVNFGIVYGITEFGLADQLECSYSEARNYLIAWRRKFPVAWNFILRCMAAPRRGENLLTPFGNRKRHHVVTQENIHALEKEAANFPHQSVASHIMLHGGIRVHERYRREYKAYIVNTVHDSMLIEAPLDYDVIVAICEDITKVLEQVPLDFGITKVPFLAEAKIGMRWGRAYMTDYKKWKAQQPNWLSQETLKRGLLHAA